jgi:hypothetical protein
VIENEIEEKDVPIMKESLYPLPTEELVLTAEWPKRKTILGRGLLAIQLNYGAEDIADGVRASVDSITSKTQPREYHHLFPVSLLEEAELSDEEIYRALNCALITWRTNRTISKKDPITYLRERSKNNVLGEGEMQRRLKTHLIPYNQLAVGYNDLGGIARKEQINKDYYSFLNARALLLSRAAREICNGIKLELSDLFSKDK